MPTHAARRPDGREELTAAQSFDIVARPVEASLLRSVVSNTRVRAARPEKFYNEIGEIHFGINRGAKIAGYANITARQVRKDGQPGRVITTGNAAAIAAMVQSPLGGSRGLIERYFTMMKVAGDCFLIRTRENADGTGEHTGYDIVGATELDMTSLTGLDSRKANPDQPIKRIMLPGTNEVPEDQYQIIQPKDLLGRIWRPAMRFAMLADSPMAALDTQCEVLHLLTLGLKAKLLSRLALNGILYWPSEVNDIRSGVPNATEPVMDNKAFAKLIGAATAAMQNIDDPTSALPIFATGPAEYADAIKHIILDREIYETDMKLRAEMTDDILTGLDIQKQTTKNEKLNHFEGFAASEDEMRVNVKPDVETFMWAISRLIMNREQLEMGVSASTASKYMLWYDLTDANSYINSAEDARQASDRLLISSATSRKQMGYRDEDAPVGDELIRMTGVKLNDPYLATFGLPGADKINWDLVGSTKKGPNEASPGDKPETSPGNQPGKPGGKSESDTPKRLKPAS